MPAARIKQHAHLPLAHLPMMVVSATSGLADRIIHLETSRRQHEVIITRTVKRPAPGRAVVNRPRLDERMETPCGMRSKFCCNFWFQLHQAAFHVLPTLNRTDRQRLGLHWKWSRCIPRPGISQSSFSIGRVARFLGLLRVKSRHGHHTSTVGTLICALPHAATSRRQTRRAVGMRWRLTQGQLWNQ